VDNQEKTIELLNKFPEVTGWDRERLCAAFSEAFECGVQSYKQYLIDSEGETVHVLAETEEEKKRKWNLFGKGPCKGGVNDYPTGARPSPPKAQGQGTSVAQ